MNSEKKSKAYPRALPHRAPEKVANPPTSQPIDDCEPMPEAPTKSSKRVLPVLCLLGCIVFAGGGFGIWWSQSRSNSTRDIAVSQNIEPSEDLPKSAQVLAGELNVKAKKAMEPSAPKGEKPSAAAADQAKAAKNVTLSAKASDNSTVNSNSNARSQERYLEALGSLTASHLYQSFLNIGLLADAVESEQMELVEAEKTLANVTKLMMLAELQLDQISNTELDPNDKKSLQNISKQTVVLRTQADALKAYWKSGEPDQAKRFHEARKQAWSGISELLGLENAEPEPSDATETKKSTDSTPDLPKKNADTQQKETRLISPSSNESSNGSASAGTKSTPKLAQPAKLMTKLRKQDEFFQELIVTQKPNFRIQGLPVASFLQYRVVSRFTVKDVTDDGLLIVHQKVESAKVLQADALTQQAIAMPMAKLPGSMFTLHLSPNMDVTKIEAAVAAEQPGQALVDGGQGLQISSLLDRDGWKELAQLTFFNMDQPLKVSSQWSKPITHNWGSLGSWDGKIHFQYVGSQNHLHRIGYGLKLAYQSPAAGAVLGGMKINSAKLQTQQADGFVLFDAVRGHVVAAEERFRVTGTLNVGLLGQNRAIEIYEDQHFAIRIHDKLER